MFAGEEPQVLIIKYCITSFFYILSLHSIGGLVNL